MIYENENKYEVIANAHKPLSKSTALINDLSNTYLVNHQQWRAGQTTSQDMR